MTDELGRRSAEKTSRILQQALDAAGIFWPACPCGSTSSFAGVQRGTETVLWRCPMCAAAGGWKMTNEGVEFSHESAMTVNATRDVLLSEAEIEMYGGLDARPIRVT